MKLFAYPIKNSQWLTDYSLVPCEELSAVKNLRIKTMSQCEAHLYVNEEGFCVPDHSVLIWELLMDGCIADLMEVPDKENDMTGHKRYVVPEGYMLDETEFEGIIAMLRSVRGSQCRLDEIN